MTNWASKSETEVFAYKVGYPYYFVLPRAAAEQMHQDAVKGEME